LGNSGHRTRLIGGQGRKSRSTSGKDKRTDHGTVIHAQNLTRHPPETRKFPARRTLKRGPPESLVHVLTSFIPPSSPAGEHDTRNASPAGSHKIDPPGAGDFNSPVPDGQITLSPHHEPLTCGACLGPSERELSKFQARRGSLARSEIHPTSDRRPVGTSGATGGAENMHKTRPGHEPVRARALGSPSGDQLKSTAAARQFSNSVGGNQHARNSRKGNAEKKRNYSTHHWFAGIGGPKRTGRNFFPNRQRGTPSYH